MSNWTRQRLETTRGRYLALVEAVPFVASQDSSEVCDIVLLHRKPGAAPADMYTEEALIKKRFIGRPLSYWNEESSKGEVDTKAWRDADT